MANDLLLYTAPNSFHLWHLKNLLEAEGIAASVRNDILSGAMGEMPLNETWPELWLERPIDLQRARALITAALAAGTASPDWVCPGCGETIEGVFQICWRCGQSRS